MKVLVSWSGGKDSAFTLHEVLKSGEHEVMALLTTITEEYQRVSIHGVRENLLERQALSLGLPLQKVYISSRSSNEEYESRMKEVLSKQQGDGVSGVVFGDMLSCYNNYTKGGNDKKIRQIIDNIFKKNNLATKPLKYLF